MQKSYVFNSTVNFTKDEYNSFFTLPGDTGIYDAQTGMLTVYRGGDLLVSLPIPPASIASMCTLGWMRDESAPEPVKDKGYQNLNEEVIPDKKKDLEIEGMTDIEIAPVITDQVGYEEEVVLSLDPTPEAPAAEETESLPATESIAIISEDGSEVSANELDEGDERIAIEPEAAVVTKKKPGPKKKA